MWWRLPTPAFRAGHGEGNRRAFLRYVEEGHVPGLLAYDGARAIGWIAVELREAYVRLARSRNLAPVDDTPVWSITCFFVDRAHRRRGVARALIAAAVAHARAAGARLVEAYPRDPGKGAVPASLYTGVPSTFRGLGFVEVARRAPHRPILRLNVSRRRARPAPARAAGRSRPGSSPRSGSGSRRGR